VQRQGHDFAESTAWYDMRVAEVLYSQGRVEEAAKEVDAALKVQPHYPAALSLLAKVRAAQGRWVEAEELYVRAVRINSDLATVIDLADLCARTGNEFLAKVNYDKVEQMDRDNSAYDRELAMYYCNHDRQLPRALELAQRDLKARQDIYAYDTLAWALFKNGRLAEADEAMAAALKLGTKDATLFYHAGRIHDELGHANKARDFLNRALAVNPHFSVRLAEDARQVLARLGGPSAR
jgi:tetratricopeptide (TPR) repeat protein